jgi:hypothetical protein
VGFLQASTMSRLLAASAGVIALVAALGACAHYRLGTGSTLSFRTLYIEPVANRTLVPQAQAIVSDRIRSAFVRDARVQPVNAPDAADATLSLALTDFRRDIAAVRENDTGLARKFNVTLTVTGTLRDRRSGRILWENRPIAAMREVFTDGGQLQAEYEIVPLLADALAQRIVQATLDTW